MIYFSLLCLWLLVHVSATPSPFIGKYLAISPGNVTLNQYCFIVSNSAISYDNTSISLVSVNDNGTSRPILKYANDNAETTIVDLDLDSSSYFTDRSYNSSIDYCDERRTLDVWINMVNKAMANRLTLKMPGPEASCTSGGVCKRSDQRDCEETKCSTSTYCRLEAGNRCQFCWEVVIGDGPRTCSWEEEEVIKGDTTYTYFETQDFKYEFVRVCGLLGSCVYDSISK